MTLTVRSLGARLFGAAIVATTLVGACAEKKGALMLAINTDMKAPKDVNAVSVTISTNGAIKHSFIGRVTPQGEVLLPATLAIVEPEDKSATIRIRVMAFQDQKPRVLRDVRTTVPTGGRTALLRIPLNFVNDGSTKSAPLPDGILPPANGGGGGGGGGGGAADFDFFSAFQPDCPDPEHETWIDGECKDSAVDPGSLPDYEDTLVFGSGKDGADKNGCFDAARCFEGATEIPVAGAETGPSSGLTLDRGSCTISENGNPSLILADSQLNLALVTSDTGEMPAARRMLHPARSGARWNEHRSSRGEQRLGHQRQRRQRAASRRSSASCSGRAFASSRRTASARRRRRRSPSAVPRRSRRTMGSWCVCRRVASASSSTATRAASPRASAPVGSKATSRAAARTSTNVAEVPRQLLGVRMLAGPVRRAAGRL